MHDWMARALPLALILLLVSALVAAASTDQSFVCTEPVSGDRYVYKEKSLPSLSTGLMTSTIVVSRLRNGTDDSSSSSSNLFQHLTGHIKFVYSQTFIILSEVLADVQGPYPLTSRDGSNSTNQLVHLVVCLVCLRFGGRLFQPSYQPERPAVSASGCDPVR